MEFSFDIPQDTVYELAPFDHNSPEVCFGQYLCFEASPNIAILRRALHALVAKTPLLAGTVTAAPGKPGWLQVSSPYANTVDDMLTIVDNTKRMDYLSSRNHRFPPSDLPESHFAPLPFISPAPAPVMRVQVSIVHGGVVLGVCLHHAALDMPGYAAVLRAWATLCRSPHAKVQELQVDRTPFSLSAARGEGRLEDHPGYDLRDVNASVGVLPPVKAGLWYLSENSLAELRRDASRGNWISTNDAVSALLWTRVITARLALGMVHAGDTTRLLNSVDFRQRMIPRVPDTFIGNSTAEVAATTTVGELCTKSLPFAARLVRESIEREATDAFARDAIACLKRYGEHDLGMIGVSMTIPCTTGFSVSSWSRVGTYGLDWGNAFAGKKCDRIRMPWDFVPGWAYPMPVGAHGEDDRGFELIVHLAPEQFELLERDNVFNRYAERVY